MYRIKPIISYQRAYYSLVKVSFVDLFFRFICQKKLMAYTCMYLEVKQLIFIENRFECFKANLNTRQN